MDYSYVRNNDQQGLLPPTPGACLFEKFFYSLSKRDVGTSPFTTLPKDRRGFHPSVFSPGVHENILDLTASDDENQYQEPEETPDQDDHLTFRACNDAPTNNHAEESERVPEVILCPFSGCNFRHRVDYTTATLDSWKVHILSDHWPKGSRDWEICRWDNCESTPRDRSSAWKHLAVHVKKFHVKCSVNGCFVYLSRADRVSQHIREAHTGERRS